MNKFPDYCIRGIRKEKFIFDDGFVSAAVYLPDERTADKRQDGGLETSINWEDDLGAVDFTLEFRDENNNYAYPNGVVRLPRQEIDHINTLESTQNTLSYERDQLLNNPYHGNLVFRGDLPKPRLKNDCWCFSFSIIKYNSKNIKLRNLTMNNKAVAPQLTVVKSTTWESTPFPIENVCDYAWHPPALVFSR